MKKAAVRQENKIDEKAVAQELTGNQEEEEEEEAECAMMAYFFSEAEHTVSPRNPPTTH